MHTSSPTRTRLASLCPLVLTLGLVLAGGGAAVAAPSSEAPAAVSRATPSAETPRAATPSEIARYTSRDRKASKELRQFAGGDTLVIGTTSVVIIVLLVVLLVVLLR